MTTPTYRSRPAHPPTMPVVTAEIDALTTRLEDSRAEVVNLTVELTAANENAAYASRSREAYRTERDAALDRVEELEAVLADFVTEREWNR